MDETTSETHILAALNHLRDQHRKSTPPREQISYQDVALKFDPALKQGIDRLLKSLFNVYADERKIPEGTAPDKLLTIANCYLPRDGEIILPDFKSLPLSEMAGDHGIFTAPKQLEALGSAVLAHPPREMPSAVKKPAGRSPAR